MVVEEFFPSSSPSSVRGVTIIPSQVLPSDGNHPLTGLKDGAVARDMTEGTRSVVQMV